jgi:hypothetical protein
LLALRRWFPALPRRAPDLLSADILPGRIAARTREATMLGVTSVNRCRVIEERARARGLLVEVIAG